MTTELKKKSPPRLKAGAADLSQDVMDSFSDSVYIIDVRDYRVLACNATFLTKHGLSKAQVLGRPCYELTHDLAEPCNDEFNTCPLKETLKTGKHSRAEHIHFLANGVRVYEEISTSPIFEKSGEILKVVSVARDVTARKHAEEALKQATEFSLSLMASIDDAVSIVDVNDFRILGANAAFLASVGLTEAEVLGQPCYELIYCLTEPCAAPNLSCPLVETVRTGKHSKAEQVIFLNSGEKTYVEVSTSPVFEENGKVVKAVHLSRDITERRQLEGALLESENKFRGLTERALVGIYIVQDSVFRYLNPKFVEIFGYEREELIGRMGPRDLTRDEDWSRVEENLRKRLNGESESIHYEFGGVTKEKKIIDLEVYGTRAMYQGKPAVIGTLLDISERKRSERALAEQTLKLELLTLFDELTGLYNRRGFLVLAGQQLKTAERLGKGALLLFADLDCLKEINDTLGRESGDAALKETAALFRETSRESDIIARLGGNEFVVLVMASNRQGEKVFVTRFEENLVCCNAAANREYPLSLSLGFAIYDPISPCSLYQLIEQADAMMYTRKSEKKRRQGLKA